jgi:hypothetical protein
MVRKEGVCAFKKNLTKDSIVEAETFRVASYGAYE